MKNILTIMMLLIVSFFFSQEKRWIGVGFQKDTNSYWPITVTQTEDKEILVDYYSLGCSGKWIVQEDKKDKIIAIEKIITGKDICNDNGKILIVKDNIDHSSKRVYFYMNKEDKEEPFAFAMITEQEN